ncbi:alcohol dehydrogenase catalytic domain-containing protein [Halorhabdus amylolytica]|uniref:alcohol dehydrogenase catalytic domain-containing protein n=1 Tax=Halorhabdus amylolytica TaxID=2559573 RepID=UPI0010AA5E67|nr:alcohol dehydrogenase catalytic domain-containing protein [Halorhabdus amylolytica]
MRASALTDIGSIEVVERDRPEPADDEVLVEVGACGVCTTDFHMYHGSFRVETPLVLGHESAGTIVESRANGFEPGDRVAINPTIPCNRCSYCKRGETHLCENNTVIGGAGETILDGAFAEYVRVPATNVELIGDLPIRNAAFAEPLACAVHGVGRAGIEQGEPVALIGAGPVGLLLVQVARNRGAGPVIVSEPDDRRRELAEKLGADKTIDPTAVEDTVEAITRVAGKVAVGIEAVGAVETIQQAFDVTRDGGTTLIFGVPDQEATMELSPFDVYFTEVDLHGTYSLTQEDFERAVSLLRQERIEVASLISAELGLDEIPDAFESMERNEGLKNLVVP